MCKYEYMGCNYDLRSESDEEFMEKINKLGEDGWEIICPVPTLLTKFVRILLKRKI